MLQWQPLALAPLSTFFLSCILDDWSRNKGQATSGMWSPTLDHYYNLLPSSSLTHVGKCWQWMLLQSEKHRKSDALNRFEILPVQDHLWQVFENKEKKT